MWLTLLQIVLTALLSSLLTLGIGYWVFERRLKQRLWDEIDHCVEDAVAQIGREVEERVKQGVIDGVASLPSTEVIAGAGRTAAKSGVDLVSTLLGMGRRP